MQPQLAAGSTVVLLNSVICLEMSQIKEVTLPEFSAGYFKLASLVQYVPLPTVGGYLGSAFRSQSRPNAVFCSMHTCFARV